MSLPSGSSVIPGWTITTAELVWINNANVYGITTPFGNSFLDLTGYHNSSPYGGVSQTINTTIGQNYTLSLSLGVNNTNSLYSGPISVTASAGSINQIFGYDSSGSGNFWGDFNFNFTASSSSTPISIVGLSTAGGTYIGLDNVSVTAVPWEIDALPVVGTTLIFAVGVQLKRKKAQKGSKKEE